jgi:hypothetical protein
MGQETKILIFIIIISSSSSRTSYLTALLLFLGLPSESRALE